MWEILFFVAGLIVGWNFLPQPEFVRNFVEQSLSYVMPSKEEEQDKE